MKISYRTHQPLEALYTGDLKLMKIPAVDQFTFPRIWFTEVWNDIKSSFRSEVNYITTPFAAAADTTFYKMQDVLEDMLNGGVPYCFSGTYLIGSYIIMIDFNLFSSNPKDDRNNITVLSFLKSGQLISFSRDKNNRVSSWFSQEVINGNIFGTPINTKQEKEAFNHSSVWKCVLLSMFKKYASVETTLLPAGKKVDGIDCKHFNDTKIDVTYLDSKWFTTLVKSDGFNVRGHFRFQPKKKDGEWTKELIWINEFQKTGYTAPARKLQSQD